MRLDESFDADPSTPSPTGTRFAIIRRTGAVPEPRSELEPARLPEGTPEFAAALVPVPAVPLDQLTPPVPSGIAAIESMLAGAELSMVGCGEEEAW